jgi:hypothetical protein
VSESARKRMTSAGFVAWATEQPENCHHELAAGEVVVMAPERAVLSASTAQIVRDGPMLLEPPPGAA